METSVYLNKFKHVRYNFFKWRYESDILHKSVLAFGFACLTGLSAQARFYLPWTPVPITCQTFAVLLSGVVLGRWGGVSQCMYASLGAGGLPWFAGWKGGIGVILGPTGGYIIGFIFASFFLGHFVDKYIRSRCFVSMVVLMVFANFVLIYIFGLLHLYFWFYATQNISFGLWELLMKGMIPFIVGDIIKIACCAGIAKIITPKTAYDGEIDADKMRYWRLP